MTTPERPDDEDAAMRRRLDSLTRDLAGPPGRPGGGALPPGGGGSGVGQAMSLGFRVMSEFVAAVVVGGFIGWLIDRGLGTSPFGLIVFIGLGTAAGFWGVYRVATASGSK